MSQLALLDEFSRQPSQALLLRTRGPLFLQKRVAMLSAPRAADEELLRSIHSAAAAHLPVRGQPSRMGSSSVRRRQGGPSSRIKRLPPSRPGQRAKETGAAEKADQKISKAGRRSKQPSRFDDIDGRPYRRVLGQESITATSRKAVQAAAYRSLSAEREAYTESRVGGPYQAVVQPYQPGAESSERDDVLVWSTSRCHLTPAEVSTFEASALLLLGGPPQNPPTHLSARPQFAAEMALGALHLAAYERQAALQALGSRAVDPRDLWSKAEERHFHAALGKHKKDPRRRA